MLKLTGNVVLRCELYTEEGGIISRRVSWRFSSTPYECMDGMHRRNYLVPQRFLTTLTFNFNSIQWWRKQIRGHPATYLRGPSVCAMITKNMFACQKFKHNIPIGGPFVSGPHRALVGPISPPLIPSLLEQLTLTFLII